MKQSRFFRFQLSFFLKIAVTIVFVIGSPAVIHFFAVADAPVITISSPADGQYINTVTPIVRGSTYTNSTVNVYIDDQPAGTTTASSDGSWQVQAPVLAEVAHTVYATATNDAGEVSTSNIVRFTVDVTPPEVEITYPQLDSYVNLPLIEGKTEPEAEVVVYVDGVANTVRADMLGYWFYFDEFLSEGSHSVYARAVDRAGNTATSLTHNFVLDMTRPTVSALLDPPDVMTRVYLEQTVRVQVYEESPLDLTYMPTAVYVYKINSADGTVDTSVYGTVSGSVYYNADLNQITFTPDAPLEPITRYFVTLNPLLADAAGNLITVRSWTFTTMGADLTEKPHGDYMENVNTCVTCHSSHRAEGPKLSKSKFAVASNIDNYCNACHDGTVAPIPEKWQSAHKHNFKVSMDGTPGTNSCASCHNPHLTWTEDNPNMLQDFYMYPHTDATNPFLPNTSEQALCESCHEAKIKDDPRVSYVRYQYKNRNSASGAMEDYGLCLRCHDGGNATNIAVYYSGTSRHMLTALDDSPLNGFLPCSDCHETHGSANIKLLKTQLGHDNAQPFQAGPVWDAATERQFCTSCHNNLTELYGIMVGFDPAIPGHEAANQEACSNCHGGSPVAAAHGPD